MEVQKANPNRREFIPVGEPDGYFPLPSWDLFDTLNTSLRTEI
jgi:hypothetical protein